MQQFSLNLIIRHNVNFKGWTNHSHFFVIDFSDTGEGFEKFGQNFQVAIHFHPGRPLQKQI